MCLGVNCCQPHFTRVPSKVLVLHNCFKFLLSNNQSTATYYVALCCVVSCCSGLCMTLRADPFQWLQMGRTMQP
jgi:hypothetical protein